jgi:hypothetical protein
MAISWNGPPDFLRNDYLAKALYEEACKSNKRFEMFPTKPPTRWQRCKWRVTSFIERWTPRVHLGPCNHDDCY